MRSRLFLTIDKSAVEQSLYTHMIDDEQRKGLKKLWAIQRCLQKKQTPPLLKFTQIQQGRCFQK